MRSSRALILAAVLAASLAAPPLFAQKTAPAGNKEALSVLDRMIAAMGGRKVLESIKDVTISGTAELILFGVTAPVTVYQKQPDKVRVDVTVGEANMTIIQAFDGRKGWFTDPQSGGAVEEMPDHLAREFGRQAGENQALLFPQKHRVTYVLKPKAVVEGKDHVVLEQTLADGTKTTYFLDPETHLPNLNNSRIFSGCQDHRGRYGWSLKLRKTRAIRWAMSARTKAQTLLRTSAATTTTTKLVTLPPKL